MDLHEKHPVILEKAFDVSPPVGWEALVDRALGRMFEADPSVRVVQVKEKFSELRIYVAKSNSEAVQAIVSEAAEEASHTCDMCGKPGSRRGGPWIQVRCDDHAGILG